MVAAVSDNPLDNSLDNLIDNPSGNSMDNSLDNSVVLDLTDGTGSTSSTSSTSSLFNSCGSAVYPTAWEDGKCRCFREKKLVKKAWGFTKLYDNVPHWQRAEARQCVHALFGGGNGPYYRVHHGQNLLSPQKQEEILKVVAMFGSIEGIGFDHYVTDWDFG